MAQTFLFKARNMGGQKVKGFIQADSEKEAVGSLLQHGYAVTHCSAVRSEPSIFEPKIPLKELAVMCRQLSSFVRTGIPIVEALKTVRQYMSHERLKTVLGFVIADLSAGEPLADSFDRHGRLFPPFFIKMLRVAEEAGNLEQSLTVLADHFQKEYQLRKKIRRALTYPAVVMMFALVMIHSLIMLALPAFADIYGDTQASLPWITQALLDYKAFLDRYAFAAIAVPLIVFPFLAKWFSAFRKSKKFDEFILRVPVAGRIHRKIAVYRFSKTLRDAYAGGVPIDRAIQIASEAVNNRAIAEAAGRARERIQSGASIAAALKESHVFPNMLISMMHAVEESGDIDPLLADVAEFNRFELEQDMEQFISFIEPALMIAVGLVVGLVVIGIVLPLYEGMMLIE
ncbi:MAG TPA: type II secretion system F family protein [Paenibacillaceae bacterium]